MQIFLNYMRNEILRLMYLGKNDYGWIKAVT